MDNEIKITSTEELQKKIKEDRIGTIYELIESAGAFRLDPRDYTDLLQRDNSIEVTNFLIKMFYAERPEQRTDFLEHLTPGKVKKALPEYELTAKDISLLTYSKEEMALLKTGTQDDADKIKARRRGGTLYFLSQLKVEDFIKILQKNSQGKSYNVYKPEPSDILEGFGAISTTQLYINTYQYLNIADLQKTADEINRKARQKKAKIQQGKNGEEALIIEGDKVNSAISVHRTFDLQKVQTNGIKEFDYFTGQIYKQVFDTTAGKLTGNKITITDSELTASRVCGTDNKKVTRRNWLEFESFLYNYSSGIINTSYQGKDEDEPTLKLRRLITGIDEEHGGTHIIYLNTDYDFKEALRFYIKMPNAAYQLSPKAYNLLRLVLEKARMTAADRKHPEFININLTEVVERLQLPTDTKKTRRDLKEPISETTEEINRIINDISLTINADDGAPLREYLSGYITAELSGDLLEIAKTINEEKPKQIKKQRDKHRRAAKAAQAKAEKKEKTEE